MKNCFELAKCTICEKSIIQIFKLYTESHSICTICLTKVHNSCFYSSRMSKIVCPHCKCNNVMIMSKDYDNKKYLDFGCKNGDNYTLI